MKTKKHFIAFCQKFFHARVIIFVFIGTGIIFLTFLTNNNAAEISISAVASIFIGIGANNFSSLETNENNRRKQHLKKLCVIQTIELLQSRINKLNNNANSKPVEELRQDLFELEKLITITLTLISEHDSSN